MEVPVWMALSLTHAHVQKTTWARTVKVSKHDYHY